MSTFVVSSLVKDSLIFLAFSESLKTFVNRFLTFNPVTLVVHIFASLFVIICVIWWFWKPTNKFIAKHKVSLSKTHRELITANQETKHYLQLLKEESENILKIKEITIIKVKEEAEHIILAAKQTAETEAAVIAEEAKNRAIAFEKQAHFMIKNSIVDLSIDLTKKLVGDNINEENSQKIINDYIKNMESKSVTNELR